MKFVLTVHQPDNRHAFKFAAAALDAGHEIPLIFFYQDGIQAAKHDSPEGKTWQQFARERSIPLAICIGAAARRGLVDESAPERSNSVYSDFEVVGLGQYIAALVDADRLITFAADS